MSTHPFLAALSLFTLVAVLAFGFWQFGSVRRSQTRRGEPTGTMTHEHFSPDDDLAARDPLPDERRKAAAGRVPEAVGDAATAAAAQPTTDRL